MNTEIYQKYQQFIEQVRPVLKKERLLALNKSFEKGLPNRKWEDWKYISLKPLDQYFEPSKDKGNRAALDIYSDELTINCINGFFDVSGVQAFFNGLGIEVDSLERAIETKKVYPKELDESFAYMNAGLYENGIYIKVRAYCELEKPIAIRYKTSSTLKMINPFVVIELEKNAQIKFHEIFEEMHVDFVNAQTQIVIEENASFKYYKFLYMKPETSYIGNTYGKLSDKSRAEVFQLSTGTALARENMNFQIDGSGAECFMKGISLLKNENIMDHNISVFHEKEASLSRQYFKSILKDKSHYVFQGKIFIEQVAQKTDSEQLNRNLILDTKARVDTKPQLEVYADDVKANHGAAIGQLDGEEKFYLLSRGLDPKQVNEILCQGYVLDIASDLQNKFAKKHAINFLNEYIKEFI